MCSTYGKYLLKNCYTLFLFKYINRRIPAITYIEREFSVDKLDNSYLTMYIFCYTYLFN